jgi:3-hydroxyisobutyrate dehydrogenase-like beta-hydroxyacid dehydrogenase
VSTPQAVRVGFIGLGSQGAPMARRIVDEGFPLTLWARRPESLQPFADTAATRAATPAELGAASDVVGICVVADADVEDVLLRADGVLAGMAPGGVVVVHSTVHPDTCRRLAVAAAGAGVAVVDAPVSGGGAVAAARGLLVMVGGAEADVARCRPVLDTFGDPVLHLGPLGSGQLAKAMNNFLFTAQVGVALDTFAFADRVGIDKAALAEVLSHGSGGSTATGIVAGMGFDTRGLAAVAAGLLRKDVGIMLDVARAMGTTAPELLVGLTERALTTLESSDGE